jgi:OOP family OmpA-OmpF porin
MTYRKLSGLSICALAFAGNLAHADDSGFYLGAGAGQATQSAEGFDGKDTSFKLLGGYTFNKYLAAEAGYIDGGEQSDTTDGLTLAVKSDGFFAAALAKLPLGEYAAPYVKFGYVFYDSTATVSAGGQSLSESSSDEDLLYGVGCEFKFTEHFRLRAEYERVDVPDTDFDIFSIVAAFHF